MSISSEEFNRQSINFISRCREVGESWRLFSEFGGSIREVDVGSDEKGAPSNNVRLMLVKDELRLMDEQNKILNHEYSVVYSESFEVPVMYFSICEQNGSPLGYEKTLSTLVGIAGEDINQVVHQVEHPILFRPFFMIHPCKTKFFMESHKELNPGYYLICWLSTVGSIMGLKIDTSFASLK